MMHNPDGRCAECGFDWSSPLAVAVDAVAEAPTRYEALFRSGQGPKTRSDRVWTAREYLWHMVDVLRYGTERGCGLLNWTRALA